MSDLFGFTKPRKPRKLMHVVDAGSGVIKFECGRCGHNTGWIEFKGTVSEAKRGRPCPKCNKESE